MKKTLYPIITFVILQLLASASLVLWIIWYVVKRDEYENAVQLVKTAYSNLELSQSGSTSLVLGIIFLSVIIITSSLIFIEWLKVKLRYRNGSDFISGFTHELMTPLTCIQMNLEAALESAKISQEKKDKLLETAFAESKKLQSSIDKILEIKIIEHRKNMINLEFISAKNFFSHYVSKIQTNHSEVSLQHEINCDENVLIKADGNALQVVLNNLVENAIKYSNEKTMLIVKVNTGNKKIHISIQDHGIGMQPNTMKNIFKIFYRGNTNTRGTGLGLYITKKILRSHHGKIKVSSPGKNLGTTFEISLPIKREL